MNRKREYKDLDKWVKTKKRQAKRYYKKHSQNATNSKQGYTIEEINMIMQHEISDVELSKKIGRSVRAIQVKRAKINKKQLLS